MSVQKVKEHLAKYGKAEAVLEFPVSSATVALAAEALGTEPARIAKTISFQDRAGEGCILIVAAGDAKVDSARFKARFGFKASMLSPEEVEPLTGHAVGGVCPFANPAGTRVYLDESLKRFDVVYPACGSANSAIPLDMAALAACSESLGWVDVCKGWREQE